MRPRGEGANSGAWQAQALIRRSVWSHLRRGLLGVSVGVHAACVHSCDCGCAVSVSICPLIKLQRTPPPKKKDIDLLEKVVFRGLTSSFLSWLGCSCFGNQTQQKPGWGKLEVSLLPARAGPWLPTTSVRAPVRCGLGAMHRQCGKWEDLERLCPHVAPPCKGTQERNTWASSLIESLIPALGW